jgi:anti-sigma-K factor RskA
MDRLHELLVDRALSGLDAGEAAELARLTAQAPSPLEVEGEAEELELAAASIEVALFEATESHEELPGALATAVVANGESLNARRPPEAAGAAAQPRRDVAPADVVRMDERRSTGWVGWTGWIAAAAAIVLAILGFMDGAPGEGRTPPPVSVTPTVEELRAELVESAPDAVKVEWASGGDPTAEDVAGDVVWSNAKQAGYMRFVGLEPNDPSVEQYQLWIFDEARSEQHPVDGGVFDVTKSGEVIVPIDAKLPVSDATLFAVTVERPGGVVVSSRERIATLAQVPETS